MKLHTRLLTLIFSSAAVCASAGSAGNSPPVADEGTQQTLRTMSQARAFVIGPSGYGGGMSASEKALRAIATRPDAEPLYWHAAHDPSATIEGKLYALCGLRLVGSAGYPVARSAVAKPGQQYTAEHVDVRTRTDIATALSAIEKTNCREFE